MSGYFVDVEEETDDEEPICKCGNVARIGKRTCYACDADFKDLYADMQIQDAKEGK